MENCGVPTEITTQQQWTAPQEYKAIIADKVVNALVAKGEESIGCMRELIRRVTEMKDFSHLLKEDDGRRLKKEAEVSVERLRQLVSQHDDRLRQQEQARRERLNAIEQRSRTASKISHLDGRHSKEWRSRARGCPYRP